MKLDKYSVVLLLGALGMTMLFVGTLAVTESFTYESTPLIGTVIGFVSMIILNVAQSRQIKEVDTKVDRVLNGEMEAKVQHAVNDVLDERRARKRLYRWRR